MRDVTPIVVLILSQMFPFSPGAMSSTLVDRYEKLSCAVVKIKLPGSTGTGAFINKEGDVLTAAHVILYRQFARVGTTFQPLFFVRPGAEYFRADGTHDVFPPITLAQRDIDNGTLDLAIVPTGKKTDCFIPIGESDGLKIGTHFISIGFPGSVQSSVLYEGFLSATQSQAHALGPIIGEPGQVATNNYDVLRVQMPITPGASGSPLIDDNDKIAGVVTEVPVAELSDITSLIQIYAEGKATGAIIVSGFDTNKILAELAFLVTQFESPGSGYAVPIHYLKQ